MSKKSKGSDLQGLTRLITEATVGITDLVEAMQKQVVHPPFLPSTPIQHLITNIAGFTFNSIRKSTQFIGGGLDKLLGQFEPFLKGTTTTEEGEAVRSVLNGVLGDYLEEKENPLKIEMQFRHQSKGLTLDKKSLAAAYPNINGKILLMIHGLCMNDIQWTRKGHNHGTALAEHFGKTPIYLQYNTGCHISTNGHRLNAILEDLIQNWPVPVEELTILAHSMGGLVTRSALHYGQQQEKNWIKHLKKIVFLGTPHHGASLERMGNYVDVLLESMPYAKPFARLGKIRSAGITDLRHGNILDEDWQGMDRFEKQKDQRREIPSLPETVECFSIAAILGKGTDDLSSQILGDSLVDLKSGFGQHKNPAKHLNFKEEHTWVIYEKNHLDLLSDSDVYAKIKTWFECS